MNVRPPSVRYPHSFYDVFTIVVTAVVVAAIVLSVAYGTVIRIEMAVLLTVVFAWAAWAITKILAQETAPGKTKPYK
ncbi:hypothetical protein [Halovivax cerinus]|uniref:Uncharacterized protein n=1 Tax=Halovivax cerinus TaxID=1487865 RepID=A0ABD5NNN3_9EURY|nr:hypothetical protein [Halovivax cerinus]